MLFAIGVVALNFNSIVEQLLTFNVLRWIVYKSICQRVCHRRRCHPRQTYAMRYEQINKTTKSNRTRTVRADRNERFQITETNIQRTSQ